MTKLGDGFTLFDNPPSCRFLLLPEGRRSGLGPRSSAKPSQNLKYAVHQTRLAAATPSS